MKKIIVVFLMGLVFALTPYSLKAINYTSIDEPIIELNNFTLNEVFTDTLVPLTDYAKNDINNITINGSMTYADFFATYQLISNGDFIDGESGWGLPVVGWGVLSNENNTLRIDRGSVNQYYFNNSGYNIDFGTDKFYLSFDGKVNKDTYVLNIALRNGGGGTTYNQINTVLTLNTNYQFGSLVFTSNNELNRTLQFQLTSSDINVYFNFDNIKLFILTALQTVQLYSPLYDNTFDNLSDAECKAQMDLWVDNYTNLVASGFSPDGTIYVAPSGNIYDITSMKQDIIYSILNNDTLDNLDDTAIENQITAWELQGVATTNVLSYTEFLTFAPALSREAMVYWYNYYIMILDFDDNQAGVIDDLEETILFITLVLFLIGIALAIYFKHKIMFFVTGLLWFVPIIIIPNIFIITFSVIMIILFGLLAFYNPSGKDFD